MDRVRTISIRDLVPHDARARSSLLGGDRSKNLIRCNWNGRVVAVKFLTDDAQEDVLSERARFWNVPAFQHVGQVLGISDPACSPLFIVLPYYSKGNITQFLARHPDFDRKNMIFEIALGMHRLHSCDIVHGGLKPTNVMVTDDLHACITDFDTVRIQPSRNTDSHHYFSPEAWKGIVSPPSDVYAFAMCAYQILTSKMPWGTLSMNYIYQLVVGEDARPDRPESAPDLTDQIWSIMEESWHKESRLRPTFEIIINMWQDPNEAAYSARGGPRRRIDRVPVSSRPPPPSRWSETTVSPPAYEPPSSGSRVRRPLPIPIQDVSTATSTTQSVHPRDSTMSGPYASARTDLMYSPPYSSCSSISTPSTHDLFSPARTPLTPISAPLVSPAREERSRPVPILGNPPSRMRPIPSEGFRAEDEDSPVLGRSFIDDIRRTLPSPSRTHSSAPSIAPSIISGSESIRSWEASQPRSQRRPSSRSSRMRTVLNGNQSDAVSTITTTSETISIRSSGSSSGSSNSSGVDSSALFLVGGLQAEMTHGRKSDPVIDVYMAKIYRSATECDQNAHKLITAGVVPLLITLLKRRANVTDKRALEVVLITLGVLSHDSISANVICRTQTAATLIQLCSSRNPDEVVTLSLWCLNRICRTAEVANGLMKLNIVSVIKQLASNSQLPPMAIYCLGTLIQSDALADTMESLNVVHYFIEHLRKTTQDNLPPEDTCAGLYAVARISRSIRLAKILARAGCIPLLTFNLRYSNNADVLNWSVRAIGCLMRPGSIDMARHLLDAGAAEGLARVPKVLAQDCLYPLASFGFAIQRFSCAEWGNGTRVALLEAGVIDSLLAALRTAAMEPCYEVQVELALGVSLLGDVGGAVIRKEIVNAGGIDILKSVGSKGPPEVAKACDMAITSITGSILSRNAAAARTALLHEWIGGAPDHQPTCPLTLTVESRNN